MPTKKLKNKIYFFLGGVTALLLIILFFIIMPTIGSIQELNTKIYDQRVNFETIYFQAKNLKNLVKLGELKSDLDKIKALYIDEGQELAFITKLEEIAAKYTVEQKIDLQPAEGTINGLKTMVIKISLKGDFKNVLKYLEGLETSNYYFNPSTINIIGLYSKKDIAPGGTSDILPGVVNANLEGKIFLLPKT